MRAAGWRSALALVPLFLRPARRRARAVYELLGTRSGLGETSLYLNLGYWDGAETYDGACEALARLLGESAGLGPADEALDVGFGFADQDPVTSPAAIAGRFVLSAGTHGILGGEVAARRGGRARPSDSPQIRAPRWSALRRSHLFLILLPQGPGRGDGHPR